ncbi:MAG: chorismate synthase [Thermodesulfobacteriota bacterium]|nr:chorismate synthase [Thermodesulfobacteriota bacterium]
MLRYLTAGESHGKALVAIVEGIPSGLSLCEEDINIELKRRQVGYGRGPRMEIERDRVEIISGIRWGKTLGSPFAIRIENLDWKNWKDRMSIYPGYENKDVAVTMPRPGHADIAGALKYNQKDIRNILERASARETTVRVAVGAVAKVILREFGINIHSFVISIGGIRAEINKRKLEDLINAAEKSDLRCPDPDAEKKMKEKIHKIQNEGDSLGGIFEVLATGVPVGLGSHVHWDRKLDGRIAGAIMSIQAIKGVEIGIGFEAEQLPGSKFHDQIFYSPPENGQIKKGGFYRRSNNAGGIEGGISNGETIIVKAFMKPISTLYKPLNSVDIITKEKVKAQVERSDICRVPSAAVIGEAALAIELAGSMIEKFSGDSLEEMKRNFLSYLEYLKNF